MDTQKTNCRICGQEIPEERLEVLPETLVCTPCSQKIGGEFELKVTTNSTGKAGSLKRTGTDVTVTLQRKRLV